MTTQSAPPAPAIRERTRELPFEIVVDQEIDNPEWDSFVASTAGGHHAQTARWARVKAVLGWSATRLVIRRGERIVGGVQLLTRSLGRVGSVAFAPRGPLILHSDAGLLDPLHRALMEFGREHRVRYLKVQPAADQAHLVSALETLGWTPSAMDAAPTATVRVDLDPPEEEIFGRIHKSARNYIRASSRRGLVLRVGGESDLGTYYEIVLATSRRQGFAPYPARYYERMWREFGIDGQARLLMAELDGVVLASTLVIGYGDSATSKMGGWLGERSRVRPNEAMHWAGIQWAKATGYRFYDFDGIHKSVAQSLSKDGTVPPELRTGVGAFKLQFGGDVVLFPGALDTAPSRVLRSAVRVAAPRLDKLLPAAHRALGRGRTASGAPA